MRDGEVEDKRRNKAKQESGALASFTSIIQEFHNNIDSMHNSLPIILCISRYLLQEHIPEILCNIQDRHKSHFQNEIEVTYSDPMNGILHCLRSEYRVVIKTSSTCQGNVDKINHLFSKSI